MSDCFHRPLVVLFVGNYICLLDCFSGVRSVPRETLRLPLRTLIQLRSAEEEKEEEEVSKAVFYQCQPVRLYQGDSRRRRRRRRLKEFNPFLARVTPCDTDGDVVAVCQN